MKLVKLECDRYNHGSVYYINPEHICSIYEEELRVGNTSDSKKERFTIIQFSGNAGNSGYSHRSIYSKLPIEEVVRRVTL